MVRSVLVATILTLAAVTAGLAKVDGYFGSAFAAAVQIGADDASSRSHDREPLR